MLLLPHAADLAPFRLFARVCFLHWLFLALIPPKSCWCQGFGGWTIPNFQNVIWRLCPDLSSGTSDPVLPAVHCCSWRTGRRHFPTSLSRTRM